MEARKEAPLDLEDFGPMTQEYGPGVPTYNLRALFAYCQERGIEPEDLSENELKQFQTN